MDSAALRAKCFVALAAYCARAPRFRGRNRAFLALHHALGLQGAHVFVDAVLTDPIAYRARLDLHSWLQRLAFLDGGYEPDSVALLLRLRALAGGDGALLDIGANVGLIAIPAALMMRVQGAAERPCVVALEAVADNAAALADNVARNAAQALVTVINAAVGAQAGAVDIQVEGDLAQGAGTGTANILPDRSSHACERIALQVTTLDALMAQDRLPPRCAVVKIDTDGYDLKALQGGADFLTAHRPMIFGEFSAHCMGWHGQTLTDVIAFAENMDYRVFRRRAPHWRFAPVDAPASYEQDLLLAPREKAHLLAPLL